MIAHRNFASGRRPSLDLASVAANQKWLDETLVPNATGEFRLGQKRYDEKISVAINTTRSRRCPAIGVHVDGWSREQAMALIITQTFQQEREAAGKWVRAQLTSAQLPASFIGFQEPMDLRREVEAARGKAFNLKTYHDQLLSYGAPPVRFVRQLMLEQPIQ